MENIIKIKLGLGTSAENRVCFGNSQSRSRELEKLGIKKQDPKFNNLLGQAIDSIKQSNYTLNVLRFNGEFKEVKPTNETVKGFFESQAKDIKRVKKSEKITDKDVFFTEFTPMIKQYGKLIISYTINTGYELIIRYYLPEEEAEATGSNYINMIFCRLKTGKGTKGVFKYSSDLINTYTDEKATIIDSEVFLKEYLTPEEKEVLELSRTPNNPKRLDYEEIFNLSENMKEIGQIKNSNNIYGVKEINTDKELINYMKDLEEEKKILQDKFTLDKEKEEKIFNINYAIDYIKNTVYGKEEEEEEETIKFIINNKITDKHPILNSIRTKEILGITGSRKTNLNEIRPLIKEYLKNNQQFKFLINGGAKGVDTGATIEALKAGLGVLIVSPLITEVEDLPPVIKAVQKETQGTLIIINLFYQEEETRKQFKERNNLIALISNKVVYYGDIGKTGTGQTVRLCKKHNTETEEL